MADDLAKLALLGGIVALKYRKDKKEQEQQKAINDILKSALSPQEGKPEVQAKAPALSPPSIVNNQGQPIAGTEGQAPTFTQPELAQYPGIAGTEGFTPGSPAIPPQQKSALQMYQAMVNHPLFNELKPGQAENLIKTITGVGRFLPEEKAPSSMTEMQLFLTDPETFRQYNEAKQPQVTPYQKQTLALQDRKIQLDEEKTRITELKNQATDEATTKRLELYESNIDRLGKQLDEQIRHNQAMEASGNDQDKLNETVRHNKAMEGLRLKEIQKPSSATGEKTPSFGQQQTIASVKSDLRKFRGTIYSPAGIPIPTNFGSYAGAMDYLSKVRLDPAQFKTELDIYKGIDRARAKGMAIVIDTSGNVYAIKPNEVRAYVKAGYQEIPK